MKFDVYTETIFKKCLKQRKNYSFACLKEELDIYNDEHLILGIIDYIAKRITSFNYNSKTGYYTNLLKCFKYLNFNSDKLNIDNNDAIINALQELDIALNQKLTNPIYNIEHCYLYNEKILLEVKNQTKLAIINFKYNKNERKVKLKEAYQECDENEYEIISKLIFKTKNTKYVEQIVNKIPGIANIRSNNKPLFNEIVTEYIKALDNNIRYDINYYYEIINMFLKSRFFDLNPHEKGLIISSLYQNINKDESVELIINNINSYQKNNNSNLEKHHKNYDVNLKFSNKLIGDNKVSYKNYCNLTNRRIITIDNPNGMMFEDAFSLDVLKDGNYLLGIYITDIADYIDEDKLYDEINNHNICFGFNKKTNRQFSLQKSQTKRVIAHSFELTKDLNLIEGKIERALIKVKCNLKMRDVYEICRANKNDKLTLLIKRLVLLSDIINKNKDNINEYHSYKELINETFFHANYDRIKNKNTLGSDIVKNLVSFLNSYLADYCQNNNKLLIYKNNNYDKNNSDIRFYLEQATENSNIAIALQELEDLCMKTRFSPISTGHDGLGFANYTEATKPVDSVVSLINQLLITKYVIDKEKLTKEQRNIYLSKLELVSNYVNQSKQLADEYQKELERVKKRSNSK